MAVTSAQVTVSTTAVALNTESGSVSGTKLTIKPATAAVDLGPSTVTAGSGFSVAADATVTIELSHGEQLFAIRSSAVDSTVHVLRTGA